MMSSLVNIGERFMSVPKWNFYALKRIVLFQYGLIERVVIEGGGAVVENLMW